MNTLITHLSNLARRRERFTFDIRGNCLVYGGVIAAYRATQDSDHFTELPSVITHAMEHDGIVGAWRDPEDGRVYFDSCRLFTDLGQALRFARIERQHSVYNLNREEEVPVEARHVAA